MKNTPFHQKTQTENNETNLFKDEFKDIAPIKQDKIPPQRFSIKQNSGVTQKNKQDLAEIKQAVAAFEFSDGFEGHFDINQPLKYVKPETDSHEVKRLRRGDYPPDLILDLHGIKKEEAKYEIAALIHVAQKKHIYCVSIMHGKGTYVLKKSIPNWLIQHPAVMGFHQAPKEWGGQAALLVLIDLPLHNAKY